MAFSDLQVAVSSFSGLSVSCVDKLKILNDEVIGKLHQILNVNETESIEDFSLVGTKRYVFCLVYNYPILFVCVCVCVCVCVHYNM